MAVAVGGRRRGEYAQAEALLAPGGGAPGRETQAYTWERQIPTAQCEMFT